MKIFNSQDLLRYDSFFPRTTLLADFVGNSDL